MLSMKIFWMHRGGLFLFFLLLGTVSGMDLSSPSMSDFELSTLGSQLMQLQEQVEALQQDKLEDKEQIVQLMKITDELGNRVSVLESQCGSADMETDTGLREEVKAVAGSSVSLRCAVNRAQCGDFHSIKWYKENRRVFVYSPVVDFSKAEGELLERSSLVMDTAEARLTIDPILTTDEGEYKCEITFLDISNNCPVLQLVKLTTLTTLQ